MPDIWASKSLAPNADTEPLEPLMYRSQAPVLWEEWVNSTTYCDLRPPDPSKFAITCHENHQFHASRHYKSSLTYFIIYSVSISNEM